MLNTHHSETNNYEAPFAIMLFPQEVTKTFFRNLVTSSVVEGGIGWRWQYERSFRLHFELAICLFKIFLF